MCAVSMIYDRFNDPFTNGWPKPIEWPGGLPPSLPWTRETFDELKQIIERLNALDKKLGLPHCEDPKKGEWMQAVEERLKRLEGAASPP